MEVNFLNERAKKHLQAFLEKLDAVGERIEGGDLSLDEVKTDFAIIRRKIDEEVLRSETGPDSDTEEYFFKPALQEVELFLSKVEGAGSPDEVASVIYDAKFSLDYYRAQLNEM